MKELAEDLLAGAPLEHASEAVERRGLDATLTCVCAESRDQLERLDTESRLFRRIREGRAT